MTPLNDSPFSRHFVLLTFLGAWVLNERNSIKVSAYTGYKVLMSSFAMYGIYMLLEDLVLVFGDFKKMTWNLCISTLITGSYMKNLYCIDKSQFINKLRRRLHKDVESRKAPEYAPLHDSALKTLKYLNTAFYGVGGVSVSVWLVTQYFSYLWGPKEWPVPFSLPFEVNKEDDLQYNVAFFLIGAAAMLGLSMIMEQELAMFTLLIQLSREYHVFLKDVLQLRLLYENSNSGSKHMDATISMAESQEINPYLKEVKAKALVKQISTRQQQLIEYTELFEFCYSNPLLLQFVVSVLLVVVSLIQCLIESGSFSLKISYQLGYSAILLSDMFLVCLFSTNLHTYCFEIGEAVYSSFWYSMSLDIQKDIRMILMRSQNPPKITSGKIIVLNLHAFMLLIRNIYSWLALFQQLEFKV